MKKMTLDALFACKENDVGSYSGRMSIYHFVPGNSPQAHSSRIPWEDMLYSTLCRIIIRLLQGVEYMHPMHKSTNTGQDEVLAGMRWKHVGLTLKLPCLALLLHYD